MITPLKLEREKRKVSAFDLAVAVGVRPQSIHRIETGKVRPSPQLALRLAEFFGNRPTRDEIIFPEFYTKPNKPPRSGRAEKAVA